MIFRVSHRLQLSGNKFLKGLENVLRNDFRVEIIEKRVEIKNRAQSIKNKYGVKKGSNSIPFFCSYVKYLF